MSLNNQIIKLTVSVIGNINAKMAKKFLNYHLTLSSNSDFIVLDAFVLRTNFGTRFH